MASNPQPERLSNAEKEELAEHMGRRYSGTSQIFRDSRMFEASPAVDCLEIDRDKRNVFLFSNIYWDVGMTERKSLYDGVIPWVLDSIESFAHDSRGHLYIKPHPAEVYDSSTSLKGIESFIRDRFPHLPENVSIIAPELRINTYDLFPLINLGVVFNGTLGLEMLLHDIPVVVTGLAPYGHLDGLSRPTTVEEYRNVLTGRTEPSRPSLNEVELFAYFYFVKMHIPWTLTERAFADDFRGFAFDSLEALEPGRDPYLDHLCSCILDPEHTVIEGWQRSLECTKVASKQKGISQHDD